MSNAIKTIIVVLSLPPRVISALIARMDAILQAMTTNKTTFPNPPVPLATVTNHVAALSSAEAARKTHTGTVASRDAALAQVVSDAKQLHGYVQTLVNATPAQAENIATAAAMSLRKTAPHPKSDLAAKQGVSGTVHLSAKSVKGATAHEWQYSADGGKTWTQAPSTSQSKTALSSLPPGVLQFRQRAITRKGPGDWTPALTFAVS